MSSHSDSTHKKSEGEAAWTEGTMVVRAWAGGQGQARREGGGIHNTFNNKDFKNKLKINK